MNILKAFLNLTPVRAPRGPAPAAVSSASRPPPRTVQLTVEHVRQIRQRAEHAALCVAMGRATGDGNPYRNGTRQHVLWNTSFHAKLMEFETEAFAPAPALPQLQ